jgi:hypothetical protein
MAGLDGSLSISPSLSVLFHSHKTYLSEAPVHRFPVERASYGWARVRRLTCTVRVESGLQRTRMAASSACAVSSSLDGRPGPAAVLRTLPPVIITSSVGTATPVSADPSDTRATG